MFDAIMPGTGRRIASLRGRGRRTRTSFRATPTRTSGIDQFDHSARDSAAALRALNVIAQEPRVRVSFATKGEVMAGQRAVLVVELLAPGYFSGAPAFDLPDAPGLLLIPPREHPTVGSEVVDGTTCLVQRHELSVFARRAGDQIIPAFTVRFQFKHLPLDKEAVPAVVMTKPVKFVTKAPPGAEKLGSILSARNLTATEEWKPEPGGKVKAGDAYTRTITFAAPDIPAMVFLPFPAGKIDGIGIYPKTPEVLDRSERGMMEGRRRDTLVYVCQRPGRFVIPAVRLTWFDLDAQQLRAIDFPARTLEVAPNPAMATASPAATAAKGEPCYCDVISGLLAALGINGALLLLAANRARWLPWFDAFRPVHLCAAQPGQWRRA